MGNKTLEVHAARTLVKCTKHNSPRYQKNGFRRWRTESSCQTTGNGHSSNYSTFCNPKISLYNNLSCPHLNLDKKSSCSVTKLADYFTKFQCNENNYQLLKLNHYRVFVFHRRFRGCGVGIFSISFFSFFLFTGICAKHSVFSLHIIIESL